MPIVRQHGSAKSIANLAALAGESIAARRDYERREAMLAQAQEAAQRQALAQQEMQQRQKLAEFEIQNRSQQQVMAMQWENQKLLLNSQHDFQIRQMEEDAWTARALKQKMQRADEYDLAMKKLREAAPESMGGSGELSEQSYNQAKLKLDLQHLGYDDILPQLQRASTIHPVIQARKVGEGVVGKAGENMPINMLTEQAKEQGYDITQLANPPAQQTTKQYTIGQVVTVGNTKYKIVGFDDDGEPLVDAL